MREAFGEDARRGGGRGEAARSKTGDRLAASHETQCRSPSSPCCPPQVLGGLWPSCQQPQPRKVPQGQELGMGPRGVGSDVEGHGGFEHENAGQESEREQRAVGLCGGGLGQTCSSACEENSLRDVPRGRRTLFQVTTSVVPCCVKVSVSCAPGFNFSPRSVNFGKAFGTVLGLNVCTAGGGWHPVCHGVRRGQQALAIVP